MKKSKKLLCLFSTVILSISAFAGTVTTASGYYDAAAYYNDGRTYDEEPKIKVGEFTYKFKRNIKYGDLEIPYSATVVEVPNIKTVEVPKTVTYDNIKFTVTDLDLYGDYNLANKYSTENRFTNVEEMILPETIYNITEFACFPVLKKINIPKNTMIYRDTYEHLYYKNESTCGFLSNLFRNCPNLKLSLNPNNPYYIYENDLLFSKDGKTLLMSFATGNIIIPDGVEKVLDYGGYGFSNITGIQLPNTVSEIDDEIFMNSILTKITLPDNLFSIPHKCFSDSNLKSLKIGKNTKFIDWKAFVFCNNLKTVKISAKKIEIGEYSFAKCSNLKTITINGAKYISKGAFYKCKKLTKVFINNKKKAPEIEKNAFKGTKKGIKFCVKNKKVAKALKKQLKGSGVKNARIIVKNKVVYKNVK